MASFPLLYLFDNTFLDHQGLDDQGTYYQINKVEGTTPILFIHGVGLDHSIWEPQTKFFKDQTTITYDLIGHGLSTCILDDVSLRHLIYMLIIHDQLDHR